MSYIKLLFLLPLGFGALIASNTAHAIIVTAEQPLLTASAAAAAQGVNKQAAPKSEPSREQVLVKRATQANNNSRDAGEAQLELGVRMLDGAQGTEQNVSAAYKWFVLAANQSDARIASYGALGAGTTLLLHTDSPAQTREARDWLAKARKAGLARADYVEALALWRRSQGKRLAALDDFLNAAARGGDAMAVNMQGALLEREGKADTAKTLYGLAASRGSKAAAANLERLRREDLFAQYVSNRSKFNTGAMPSMSQTKPEQTDAKVLKVSYDLSLPRELIYDFARRYHAGRGVQADYLHAVSLYERAAAMGYEPARKMLALIFSKRDKRGGLDIAWVRSLAQVNSDATHSKRDSFNVAYSLVDVNPCRYILSLIEK